MPSRKLSDLTPQVRACARLFLDMAQGEGLDVLIYCTRRGLNEQARLYRRGRSIHAINGMAIRLREDYCRPDLADTLIEVGPQYDETIVTNAGPGQSLHNYGMAFDGVPLLDGKPVWNRRSRMARQQWALYGKLIGAAGLEWGGGWLAFVDYPHAQAPGENWEALIAPD